MPLAPKYRAEAETRLADCYHSFYKFFQLEERVLTNPALLGSQEWEYEVSAAMIEYRETCARLGSIPQAPSIYFEADEWFKKAANQVPVAADSFALALVTQDDRDMRLAIEHMITFADYTQRGEEALDDTSDLKDI